MNYLIIIADNNGRYAYNKQPSICRWNLRKLAEALAIGGLTEEKAKEGLELYVTKNIIYL